MARTHNIPGATAPNDARALRDDIALARGYRRSAAPLCLLVLLGKRCRRYHGAKICPGCENGALALCGPLDHGGLYITPAGGRVLLAVPYGDWGLEDFRARVSSLGLCLAVTPVSGAGFAALVAEITAP